MDFLQQYFGDEKFTEFKNILGDKYDEFSDLLGDVKFKEDDGEIYIPKYRFDEVNNKYKDTKKELDDLKKSQMTEEEKIQALIDEANEEKSKLAKELTKVKATEVFVKAGLEEKDYSELLETIVTDDLEKTLNTANLMVGVIQNKKQELETQIKKDFMDSTPNPPIGEQDKELSVGEKFAQQANEQNADIKSLWD